MAKYNGSGWHFQSERHSNAKRTGHAGGAYASARIKTIMNKHPEYKNLTFKQLSNKGVFLKYQADNDKDGVPNIKDCRPLNKKAQDDGRPAGWYDIGHKETKNVDSDDENLDLERIKGTELYAEKKDIKPSKFKTKLAKAGAWTKKELIIGYEKTKEYLAKEKKKLEEELKERREKAHIEKEAKKEQLEDFRLQEVNSALKQQVESEDDINVKALSEEELKSLAVITPRGLFDGDNRYEHELKRRIDAEARLKGDLILAKVNASKKVEERIDEAKGTKKPTKYIWEK